MAETYGTETDEHEGEYGDDHENHDAGGEAPSDYEFSEESGATADVEHNEELLTSDEKAPRRSPVLPIVAVVGGVALLGSVAWWQFGSHSSAPSPFPGSVPTPAIAAAAVPPQVVQPKPMKLDTTPPAATPVLPVTPRVASTTQQALGGADQLNSAMPSDSALPPRDAAPASTIVANAPVAPVSAAPMAPVSAAPIAPVPAVLTTAPTAPASAPGSTQVASLSIQPGPVPSAPAVPAAPSQAALMQPAGSPASNPAAPALAANIAAPVSPKAAAMMAHGSYANANAGVPSAAETAQIQALNQHINDLQAKLDRVNDQLGQVMNMVAANANPATGSVSRVKMPPHVQPHAMIAAQNTSGEGAMTDTAQNQETAEEQPVHHVTKHKKHKTVSNHTTPVEQADIEGGGTQESAGTPHTWVLRAATPGHAWLATSMDSHDLKAVQVGDKVAGIGQVTEIQQQGNGWVVRGTRGTIH